MDLAVRAQDAPELERCHAHQEIADACANVRCGLGPDRAGRQADSKRGRNDQVAAFAVPEQRHQSGIRGIADLHGPGLPGRRLGAGFHPQHGLDHLPVQRDIARCAREVHVVFVDRRADLAVIGVPLVVGLVDALGPAVEACPRPRRRVPLVRRPRSQTMCGVFHAVLPLYVVQVRLCKPPRQDTLVSIVTRRRFPHGRPAGSPAPPQW
ncbi:hypothetical protein D3C85_1238470 [compost metagenome]